MLTRSAGSDVDMELEEAYVAELLSYSLERLNKARNASRR